MTPAAGPPPLLSPEQLAQLAAARLASKRLRRAVSVATFDGWTIAIFAALTFVCGITSVSNILIGVAMGIIAYIELAGAGRLRRVDPLAARTLGFNQIALACLLIVYAIWSLYYELKYGSITASLSSADPAVASMLEPYKSLVRQLIVLVDGSLVVVAILAQGGTALYYFTRVKYIQAYLSQTPPWIIQMQQAGFNL
jgi:hypothetical protein